MNSEIIDDFSTRQKGNANIVRRIAALTAGTILAYFMGDALRAFTPKYLIDWNGAKLETIGLVNFISILFFASLITIQFSRLNPSINRFKIAAYVGMILYVAAFTHKVIGYNIAIRFGITTDYFNFATSSIIFGVIELLVSKIVIHKLRGKKLLWPILIAIGVWMVCGIALSN
ncbi:MAG: hypothetical protein AB8F78_09140 [Saprospiraceae bacterium]